MKELVIAAPHSSNPAARARTARTWQGPARRAATRQQVCCQRSRRGGTDTKGGMKASSGSSVYTFTCFETEGPSDASEPSICCARFMKKLKVPPRCRNIQTGAITRVSRVLGVRPSSEPPGRCLDLRKPGLLRLWTWVSPSSGCRCKATQGHCKLLAAPGASTKTTQDWTRFFAGHPKASPHPFEISKHESLIRGACSSYRTCHLCRTDSAGQPIPSCP